jgi:hypothetical protein
MKFHIASRLLTHAEFVVHSFLSSLISVRNLCWNESLTFQSHTSSTQSYYHFVHSQKTCSIDSFYACDVTIIGEKKYPSLKHILYWCKYCVTLNFKFSVSSFTRDKNHTLTYTEMICPSEAFCNPKFKFLHHGLLSKNIKYINMQHID